jgi:hypothetical protein
MPIVPHFSKLMTSHQSKHSLSITFVLLVRTVVNPSILVGIPPEPIFKPILPFTLVTILVEVVRNSKPCYVVVYPFPFIFFIVLPIINPFSMFI